MQEKMKFHEAADIYPEMDDATFKEFVADISRKGQLEPIKVFEGQILDGRHRYRACLQAKRTPIFEEIQTDDPVAYVVSLNSQRRHLDVSQRAMVAGRVRDIFAAQAKERQGKRNDLNNIPANLPECKHGDARDKAAAVMGVGGRTVDYATRVLNSGNEDLIRKVDRGEIAVSKAASMIAPPKSKSKPPKEVVHQDTNLTDEIEVAKPRKSKPKDAPKSHGSDGRPPVHTPASHAMHFAKLAILQLERIPSDDPIKEKAFRYVSDWMKENG